MPWKKGQSGNPSGRPKRTRKQNYTITELARKHSPAAIKTLVEVMNSENSTMTAKAIAAEKILDRAWGKAPQSVAVIGAMITKRASDMSDDELAAIAAGLVGGGDDEPPLIEGTVVARDDEPTG